MKSKSQSNSGPLYLIVLGIALLISLYSGNVVESQKVGVIIYYSLIVAGPLLVLMVSGKAKPKRSLVRK